MDSNDLRRELRNRFCGDSDELDQTELLELLLSYSEPHGAFEEAAERMISKYGSIRAAADSDPVYLSENCGVSMQTALLLSVIPQLSRIYSRSRVSCGTADNTARAMQFFAELFHGERQEQLVAASLSSRCRVKEVSTIAVGTRTDLSFSCRKIAEFAVKSGADMIIIAHNHPSGSCEPSDSDISATSRVIAAMDILEIPVADHIICGGDGSVCSVRELVGGQLFGKAGKYRISDKK